MVCVYGGDMTSSVTVNDKNVDGSSCCGLFEINV